MKRRAMLALVTTGALLLTACGGEEPAADPTDDAPEPTEDMAEPTDDMTTPSDDMTTEAAGDTDVGTDANPIQVLFVPSANSDEILAGADVLETTLSASTGLTFEASVPTSYGAVIQEMCASPDNTIGFIPAQAYVLASDQCGVTPSLKALRFGSDVYWAQFVVPRDSDAQALSDLAGGTWAFPDPGSTSGKLVPGGMLSTQGIEAGEEVEAGSHDGAVQAVYDGTADFGTSYYTPPSQDGESVWDGDPANADVPDDVVESCEVNGDGDLVCGDLQVNDARAAIAESAPDVVQKVRILAVSDPIPNDGMTYSPEFPEDLRAQIDQALLDFGANDPEGFATAFDAYSWDNLTETSDAEYDSIRALLQSLGYTIDDLNQG